MVGQARGVVILVAILAALVCRTQLAAAQAPNRAEELFDQGVAALRLGSFEPACAALTESYVLEAKLGTLLALADCLDRWRKVQSAASRYAEYINAASALSAEERGEREAQLEFARAALARLEASVPHLILISPSTRALDYRVSLDEQPLSIDALEQDIALDPGRHVIETQAAGHDPWRLELEVALGERLEVELQVGPARSLETPPSLPPAPAPVAPRKVTSSVAIARDFSETSTSTSTSAWRSLGWGLGGLGVAGLGVGAVAGVMVLQTCPGLDCESRGERGRTLALVADVGFGLGLAALVASAVVLIQTQAPAHPADNARWRPLAGAHAGGGWIGMSQRW